MDIKHVAVGSIYTMLSRMVVLLCGFVVTIALARSLGPVLFGLYSITLSILVWVEYTVSMGIPSTYRKIISEDPSTTRAILSKINRISLPYCLAVTAIFSMLGPLIARGMDDERLIVLFVISSVDIPFFGMYATYMAILNGRGQFLSQSLLAAVYSISRTVMIVGSVMLGYGVTGALIGNAIGSLCGLAMGLFYIRRLTTDDVAGYESATDLKLKQRLFSYGVPYLLIFLVASVLIHMDIWLIKSFTADKATVNAVVGFYAVAYNLARIPFFLVGAITYTVFPAVSMATFENRRSDAQRQILHSLRMVLIIVLPMIAVVLSTADKMIELLFSSAYLPAVTSFKILFVGVSVFSIYLFFITIVAAEDRQRISLAISFLLIPVAVCLHYFLIPAYGIEGAALATTLVSFMGVIISGLYVWKNFGAVVRLSDLVKLALANFCMYALSGYEALYTYHLISGYIFLTLVYAALLLALRVIDFRTVKETIQTMLNPSQVVK